MRILLAQNSLYYPAHGGGDKSNRLLIEALSARGHECCAVARTSAFGEAAHTAYLGQLAARGVRAAAENGVVAFEREGVAVRVVTNANLRNYFEQQLEDFQPEVILASTDDPAQVLLDAALAHRRTRVAFLARATLALPFGPDCAFPNQARTRRIRTCDAVVGVSEYVAAYVRRYAGMPAVHVPISLMEPGDWCELGSFLNPYVTMVNPCAVKGITIFLALADALPHLRFAAVPTWGTTPEDLAALEAQPNVTILPPVDDIHEVLKQTRIALVPSLWAEARSRVILEAMVRGIPVLASDVGGLAEAKLGVPYLLPVRPVTEYHSRVDDLMVPVAEIPEQDLGPWAAALDRLLTDRAHYHELSAHSRAAAMAYAANLNAGPFAAYLERILASPRRRHGAAANRPLSEERKKLLALRLKHLQVKEEPGDTQ